MEKPFAAERGRMEGWRDKMERRREGEVEVEEEEEEEEEDKATGTSSR